MNRKMVQETLLRKHLVIITTFDMVVIMSLLSLRVIKDKVLQMHQHNLSLSSCIKDAINNKISEIETELAQANQNDYSVEAWNNLQTALTNAKVVKMKLMQPQ